jgi:hypothetical protein
LAAYESYRAAITDFETDRDNYTRLSIAFEAATGEAYPSGAVCGTCYDGENAIVDNTAIFAADMPAIYRIQSKLNPLS